MIRPILENFNTVHAAHLGLGAIADRTGHPRAALRHYRAALALAEHYRAMMLHPQIRLAFLGNRQNLCGRAAVIAASQGQAQAALEHVEASRSLTFVDLLALTLLPQPAVRVAPAILAEEARSDHDRGDSDAPPAQVCGNRPQVANKAPDAYWTRPKRRAIILIA